MIKICTLGTSIVILSSTLKVQIKTVMPKIMKIKVRAQASEFSCETN